MPTLTATRPWYGPPDGDPHWELIEGFWAWMPIVAPRVDPARLRRLRADVDSLIDSTLDLLPFVKGMASPRAIETVRAALRRLPRYILRTLTTAGASVVVEPVASFPSPNGTIIGGFANASPVRARIAGDCGLHHIASVTLHEAGHLVDLARYDFGRGPRFQVSGSVTWQSCWERDQRRGVISRQAAIQDPCEYFADVFADYYQSDHTRAGLSAEARDFVATLHRRI